MRLLGAALLLAVAGCRPNPRNEIAAVADAALTSAVAETRNPDLCVHRAISPWRPAAEARRVDTPAPPGFEPLRAAGVFRGGGALKGAQAGGVRVAEGAGCLDLRGPLVAGDRAMVELQQGPSGWNLWLRKTDGDWRMVMTTTSAYPG